MNKDQPRGVTVSGVSKAFPGGRKQGPVQALADVSFRAEPGTIYGLLGPNGAGKTTLLRCVATLLGPDRGTIEVDGLSTKDQPAAVRGRIGLLTSDMKLSGNLSPRELLTFFGELNHLAPTVLEGRIAALAQELDLGPFLDRPVDKCSTGQKQRTSLAVSLVHDPEVVLFDEPTNGLDLFAAHAVVEFLRRARSRGRTVLLSTHIFTEAEALCDRVGILLGGQLVAEGTVPELLARTQTQTLDQAFFALAGEDHRAE